MIGRLWDGYRGLSLGLRILIWMFVGGALGALFGESATVVEPLGQLFIRLLLMAAIPLVFFNLLAGVSSLSDVGLLGRLGVRTVFFYLTTTASALTVGLVMASVLRPGAGMQLSEPFEGEIGEVPGIIDLLLDLIPANVFAAFASGNVAQVVIFALLLGIAAMLLPEGQRQQVQQGAALAADLLRQLIEVVLRLGPLGIGALAAATVGRYGGEIAGPLGRFIAAVWLAQLVMMSLYMILLVAFTGRRPWTWLTVTSPLYATTAATCSSLASLVVSMDVARRRLRLSEKVYSFTLPLGAQLNKDGTSIMLSVVLLFTAQAAGLELDLATQLQVVLIGLILSEGSSGIPGGGMVIALIFVRSFDLPLEIAGIVAGIYRLIDMGSTTTNCMGDLVWTTIASDRFADSSTERSEADSENTA